MIQDIAPKIYHNEYAEKTPSATDTVLCYEGDRALLHRAEDETISFPTAAEFASCEMEYTYLFSVDEQEFYLGELKHGAWPEGCHLEQIRCFRTAQPKYLSFAGITGYQLALWYRKHRFCGCCGTGMEKDHKERMMKCPGCGNTVYPVISPAVIVAVTHKGRILMTKYAHGAYRRFALIAGFTEIGETVEETVHREVMEEVGLPVRNLRYYKSQPWSFSGTLLMGFFCELDGEDDSITLQLDELSEGGWYLPEEVPEDEEQIALTREMMIRFKEGTY